MAICRYGTVDTRARCSAAQSHTAFLLAVGVARNSAGCANKASPNAIIMNDPPPRDKPLTESTQPAWSDARK